MVFRDWFHDIDELAALLVSSDAFVTSYTGTEQIVSGALSFAIAAGLPFVSTPYRYAADMARKGCGVLVDGDDDHGLAVALTTMLTDTDGRASMAAQSRPRRGRHVVAAGGAPHRRSAGRVDPAGLERGAG